MDWKQPDQNEALKFIQAVADENESVIFDPSLCEVHALPLSFYDGYSLTRIVNKHMIPFLLLDYLSNGESHYYMDGSEAAFHNLNAQGAISLDKDNVVDYLDLYISYVYERGNSFAFVKEGDKNPARLSGSENGTYQITGQFHYQDGISDALIEVESSGAIHVRKPTEVSFLAILKPQDEIPYRHVLEEQIVQQSKDLLSNTETGQKLLKIAEDPGVEIRVLRSPNYQGFVTNNRTIYLLMPAAEQNAKYLQALVLAYSLRDAQQLTEGFLRQPPTAEKNLFVSSNYLKNLDMIEEMCKIVEELEAQNLPEAALGLELMDLEDVYKAYKDNISGPELMQLYFDSLEKKGLMRKG